MSARAKEPIKKHEFNKKEIGARIKRLRKDAGLRQWQLAEMIGATQPAIHMYERGVLPEPRRLMQLARIGGTTVEWILTGRHWDNGSEEMPRPSDEICALAWEISELSREDLEALGEAIAIITSAKKGIERNTGRKSESMTLDAMAAQLQDYPQATLLALSAALKINAAARAAVLARGLARLRRARLHGSGRMAQGRDAGDDPEARRAGGPTRIRAGSLEPIRGHIFRLDGQLLLIRKILADRDLRAELEATLDRMGDRLESGRKGVVRVVPGQRRK